MCWPQFTTIAFHITSPRTNLATRPQVLKLILLRHDRHGTETFRCMTILKADLIDLRSQTNVRYERRQRPCQSNIDQT